MRAVMPNQPSMGRQAFKAGAKVAKADGRFPTSTPASVTTSLATARAGDGSSQDEVVPKGTANLAMGPIVTWAVKCLYQEEVLPRGPILQWFLSTLMGAKLGHQDLRTHIEAEKGISVDPPGSRKMNFRAVLDEDPPGFAGFVSDSDVAEMLTEELWEEAAMCLSQGGWPKADDIAHKYYVVTSWLQDVSEKFRSWSFGRVLVVVRFAAQQDCLLGHRNGFLVPYEHSEECERRVNAQTGLPTHVQEGEAYVKNWEELRGYLRQLLKEAGRSKDYSLPADALEVSKLKWLFRTDLNVELSETVFGHECLSRLLADPQLGEDFVLEMCQGNRYMLRLTAPSNGKKSSTKNGALKQPPPPPGLSLPEEDAPPGLSSMLDVQDESSWPTIGAPKAADPPPGLTPEKTVKSAPAAGLGSWAAKKDRTWTRI